MPHCSPNGHLHSHHVTLFFNLCQPGGRSTKWLVIVEAASTCKRKKLEAKSCNSPRQKLETKMLKEDAESSVCTYDKAMRSLPLHTSTQRCDRCTCTHAHMHTHTHLAQRYDRCWCIHLHSDTIADDAFCQSAPLESLKGVLAHARTAIRSLFMNTPAQPCNRFLHEHTETHSDATRILLGRTDHCKINLGSNELIGCQHLCSCLCP